MRARKERAIGLNTDRVGHRYPPYTYEVSREKVREYALATGLTDPTYTAEAREAPASEIVVPPTFPACFTVVRSGSIHDDPELGAHWNLVHGSQEYVLHRPIRVGDTLECTPWIVDIRQRRGMDLLTLQIDCADPSGAPVLTSRGVIVFFDEKAG